MPQFTANAARRIVKATRNVERWLRQTPHSTHRGRWLGGAVEIRIGKLDGALAAGGTATMSIWTVNSSHTWSDTGRNITVCDRFLSSGSMSAGDWVKAVRYGQAWVVDTQGCP